MFSLIACIGQNRELGQNNQLSFHIKDDMKFFREVTYRHKVLMGRKTWESLPEKLSHRMNIVVSRNQIKGADQTMHNLPDFITKYQSSPEEIFVIGGGMLYSKLLPHAKHLYLTEVSATDPAADTFFPYFDRAKYASSLIKKGQVNGLAYTITKYTKY